MSSNAIVALSLFALTLIRLPTIKEPLKRPALWAAGLATFGFTLYIEEVYYFLDPRIGGGNLVGLAMAELVIAAFWQLHKAIMIATLRKEPQALRLQLTQGLWGWALTAFLGALGFFVSDVPVTSQSLVWTYGSQPGIALMFGALTCFIGYVGVRVGITTVRHISEMSAMFRAGFALVAIGCVSAVVLLGGRGLLALWDRDLINGPGIRSIYGSGQVLATLCVAVGLSLSRLVISARLTMTDLLSRWHIVRIVPLWRIATTGQPDNIIAPRQPFSHADAFKQSPFAQLQRRLKETHDCMRLDTSRNFNQKQIDILAKAERMLDRWQTPPHKGREGQDDDR